MSMGWINKRKQYQKAFTLVELTVVVAIIAIVALLAYPYVLHLLKASESKRVERMFIDALRQARAESYTSKQDVLICTLNAQQICDRGGRDALWVFFDNNDNNQKDVDEKALYEQQWQLKYGDIELRASALRPYIRYMGDTAKPRGHFGHLKYCSSSEEARLSFKVIFNAYGQIRVERGDLVEVGC